MNGIPRFVTDHYAQNFELEWTRHRETQIDSSVVHQSYQRFLTETGFREGELKGKLVLDAGCGAGRFSIVAAQLGASVVAVDLSQAVQACHTNCASTGNVEVIQASFYALPFQEETFDFVYCIGVLQHTPDPLRALRALLPLVKRGGQIGLWAYERTIVALVHTKYFLRPFLRFYPPDALYKFVSWYVPRLLPISRFLAKLGASRGVVERLIPVAYRDDVEGLSTTEALKWSVLDTYDWFSPKYDRPVTWRSVRRCLAEDFEAVRRTSKKGLGVHAVRRQFI